MYRIFWRISNKYISNQEIILTNKVKKITSLQKVTFYYIIFLDLNIFNEARVIRQIIRNLKRSIHVFSNQFIHKF